MAAFARNSLSPVPLQAHANGTCPRAYVAGDGRASFQLSSDDVALVLAFGGDVLIKEPGFHWPLAKGFVALLRNTSVRVEARGGAIAIALSGDTARWEQAAPALIEALPQVSLAPRPLRRALPRIVGAQYRGHWVPSSCWPHLEEAVTEFQASLQPEISRLPGRSPALRRSVYRRLWRARHVLRWSTQDLSLEALAASIGYTRKHFSKLFNDVFGEAPSEFSRRVRLADAYELAVRSSTPASPVAELVGYRDADAFGRAFREHFGMTLTQARSTAAPVGLDLVSPTLQDS